MKSISNQLQGRLPGLAYRLLRALTRRLRGVLSVPRAAASPVLVPVRIESRSDLRRAARRRP